jgi:hypothetical protein
MKSGPIIGSLLSLLSCLNQLSSASSTSLGSSFRNHFILDPLFSKALIILVLFFQIILIVEFTRPNSRQPTSFLWREMFYRKTNRNTTRNFRCRKFKTSLPFYLYLSPEWHLTDPCAVSCMIPLGVLINPYPDQKGKKLQRHKILIFMYPIYNHNWRNINIIQGYS